MSWTPKVYIGEMRPWPESVKVVRGNSGEVMRHGWSGQSSDGIDVTCVPDDDYTTALATELTRVLDERDTLNSKFEVAQSMRHAEYEQYTKENAKLRAQLAEWKRVAESKQDIIDHMRDANAENAKLRELAEDMLNCIEIRAAFGRPPTSEMCEEFAQRAR